MVMMIILMILMVMINMNKDLLRTFVQPTAWRKNRDYVLYYHNWSWTVVTGAADDEDEVTSDDDQIYQL